MAGYIDAVDALGPVHYFPLNGGAGGYGLADAIGASVTNPATTRGTNFKNFVNQGGVSFSTTPGAAGAVFNGTATSWLQAPTDLGFSVDNGSNAITIALWVQFPNYTQNDTGGNNLHWIAKGDSGANDWMEWAFRLYADSHTARARNISGYYWNPDANGAGGLGTPNGAANGGALGSGAFMAPPLNEGGGTERHNAPAGSGTVNSWHLIIVEFSKTAADASGTGTHGVCRMYYGNANVAPALMNAQNMWSSAPINPRYTQGPLTLGRRVENSWTLTGTVRRLAFFNYLLDTDDMETLRQAHITYADTEGTLSIGGGGGAGAFTPVERTEATSGTGSASSVSLNVPALASNELHVIHGISNALASGNGFSTPSGYTLATGSGNDNISATTNSATSTFYRLGPAAANPTLSITANGSGRLAVTHVTVPDVASVQATTAYGTGAAGTTLTSPTLTPAATGRLLLTCWGARETVFSANGITFSGLTGTGATIASQATSAHTSVTQVASAIGYELTSGTSPTGTRTLTSSDTAVWGAFSLLLARTSSTPIANFTDGFTTFDTTKWTRSDTTDVNAASGFLTLRADPSETQSATSVGTHSLTGSNIYAKFIPVPTTNNASGQFMLQDASTTDSDFGMRVDSDPSGNKTLRMGRRTGVNTTPVWAGDLIITPYDNVAHQYMRISESGGTVTFSTSNQSPTAGGVWVPRHTMTTPAYASAVKVYITTARAASGVGAMNASQFSEMNAGVTDPTPSATVNLLSQLSDNFSSQDTGKWNYGSGQGAVAGGKLNIPTTSTEGRLRSRDYWNLENSFVDVTITPATGGVSPVTSVHIEKYDTSGTAFKVEISGSNVVSYGLQTASAWDSGFPLTFTLPVGDRIRIREGTAVGGTVADKIFVDSGAWSAASLSYIWTPRSGTGVTSPAWITQNRIIMSTKNTSGTSSSGSFDNFNTEDPATLTPVPPITDAFDGVAVDSAKWLAYGTPTQSGGNLVLDAVEGIVSVNRVNLTAAKQYVNLIDVTTAAGTYSVFRLELNGTNALQFRFQEGTIYAEKIAAGVQTVVGSVAFHATNTKYVQIREAGSQIFFEYGTVPGTMTTLGSAIANPFPINSLLVRIERSV